jgi:hypothetical protein
MLSTRTAAVRVNWTITAIAVLAVSLGEPLSVVHPGATVASRLHLNAGVVLLLVLRNTARS